MAGELTIEILDQAIAKVKEYRDRIPIEIRLHSVDWRKAKDALRVLAEVTDEKTLIPHLATAMRTQADKGLMWGIKVVEDDTLPEGTMLMVYDKDNFVKVEHVGTN